MALRELNPSPRLATGASVCADVEGKMLTPNAKMEAPSILET
jgi:hypothetical protein